MCELVDVLVGVVGFGVNVFCVKVVLLEVVYGVEVVFFVVGEV